MSRHAFSRLEADRELLQKAQQKGTLASLGAYTKLSGPGWLQSALTLGGGSLSSSLYLGVLAGFSLLWLQPFAMILGIVMLSAIGYVTMSTGERPFYAIHHHVNPVLAWGWALASLVANIVWVMPQYSLATGVLQQNLMPELLGGFNGKVVIAASILVLTTAITWSYDRGGLGVRLYELFLKLMVALIVLCFVGVVITLSTSEEGLDWGRVFAGFVPNFGAIFEPAATFKPLLDSTGEFSGWWSERIVNQQRDVLISAAATAVGINMTFLFPYSILKRGWGKEFRGLSKFDLCTGMLIPFLLATSCVVIASATQFHTVAQPGLATAGEATGRQRGEYHRTLRQRVEQEAGKEQLEQDILSSARAELAKASEATKGVVAAGLQIASSDFAQPEAELLGRIKSQLAALTADSKKQLSTQLGQETIKRLSDASTAMDEVRGMSPTSIAALSKALDLRAETVTPEATSRLRDRITSLADDRRSELSSGLGAALLSDFTGEAYLHRKLESLPLADRQIAATLVKRDAGDLAKSLTPLLGNTFGNVIFGIGVLAMALSTITLLMLISGLVICEIFNLPATGWPYRLGCLAAATGVLGPFLWSKAAFWLAIPTSVFGFILLPIAYLTFFLLMNQRSLLREEMPTGGRRVLWNLLMAIAAGIATLASIYMIHQKAGWYGIGGVIAFAAAALVVHIARGGHSTDARPG